MNIAAKLPAPLNTFVVDVPQGTYYDFELPAGSTYPLPGVTYPVDYGNIPGYFAEDGHELDLFVGSELQDGKQGCILVSRDDSIPDEHKFYVGLNEEDLTAILTELKLVLIEHRNFETIHQLLKMIEEFKENV